MRVPPSRFGVTKELADSVNTSNEPATIPGIDSGSTTVRMAPRKPQPIVRTASSSRMSRRLNTPRIDRVMKGSNTCTMPTTMAVSVCISPKLGSARPSSRSVRGTSPLRLSSTIQPKVRTTTLIINGRITTITIHRRSRGPTRAMM